MAYKSNLIKEIFIFDFYNNQKIMKLSWDTDLSFNQTSTITESEVNSVMKDIINHTLSMDSVTIPGLSK